jgi:polar amino acid transport system substrate-binding protein
MIKLSQRLVWSIILAMSLYLQGGFDSPADAQKSVLQTVIERGRLVVGVRDTSPGFSFKDDKGELVGFEIDLARELARGLFDDPTKIDFVLLSGGADRVPAIVSGRVDAVISTMSVFLERARVVEFSMPYCISKSVFIVTKDAPFKKVSDLDGKRISSRQGADLEKLILSAIKTPALQMYPNNSDAFLAMRQRRADAFFFEGGAALYLAREYAGEVRELVDDDKPIAPSYLAIAVKQGDQVWLNYVNWALSDIKLTGRLREIHNRWFATDSLLPSWAKQPM